MLDLISYKVLSFDCYGTLIDWEGGILSALSPLLSRHNAHLPDDRLLELYGDLERKAQQQAPFVNYHNVLRKIIEDLGDHLGFSPTDSELTILAESLKTWAPFPDTIPALQALKERAKLAIISNVDRDLFAHSAVHLQVPFDWLITSQDVKTYKPSHRNFQYALRTIGVPASQLLHVAQSLYHDIAPAKELGIATVWVNRKGARSTPRLDCQPDLEVPDLQGLASLMTSVP